MSFRITKIRRFFALATLAVTVISGGLLAFIPKLALAAPADPYAGVSFNWTEPKTISFTGSQQGTFKLSGNSGLKYLRSDQPSRCQDEITVDGSDSSKGTLLPKLQAGTGTCTAQTALQKNITIANASTNGAPTGGVKTTSSDKKSCEDVGGWMGFIMCPGITIIDGGLSLIDSLIMNMLDVNTNPLTKDQFKQAWGSVRDLAYIITVPIMLVMVIGTALGFDFVSAYTVKKSLPRLVLAIIFISLSYQICTFLIGLSNSVGQATLGFLTAPFGDSVSIKNLYEAGNSSLMSIITGDIASAALGVAALIGLVFFLWLFGGTILLAAGVGFLTLLFRQILIILLVLIGPLAILAWVFPGNDKLWKTWWGLFSKLLIMYPLIMALIAAGRIFAFVISPGPPTP